MAIDSALDLARKIRRGELSVPEAVTETLANIDKCNDEINAFITVTDREHVLERAEFVQRQIDNGELDGSLLAGVPIAVKDNISVKDMPLTCGSRMLAGDLTNRFGTGQSDNIQINGSENDQAETKYMATYSSTAVERLEQAGAVVIGKTNMDEFGMGSTTETSVYGATKNPHDNTRVPGGSSGGSAAAVAAGMVPCALGSDTGGSIRQPAAYCGVTGLKPTYGAVSRYGLVAYGSSLEQIGPIAGNADDCAAIFQTISGWDPLDSTGRKKINNGTPHMNSIIKDKKSAGTEGITIGLPKGILSPFSEESVIDERISERILETAHRFEQMGVSIKEIDIGMAEYVVPAYYIIACAEASSNLSRFDGVKYGHRAVNYDDLHEMLRKSRTEGFGEEVRRRIRLGTFVLSEGYYDAYYKKACQVRRLIKNAYDKAFDQVDMILMPVTPTVAPKLGESLNDPLRMYQGDLFTIPANLTGLPAVSFPCGTIDTDGCELPVGAQLIGRAFSEEKQLALVRAFQRKTG
ncbi:MAG: Asp-tRNA(Asn)/Glu-tRNA(Gln) amidotransferase subunit GatA [Eubacterium sp.]|nr:Asp-tRNA(Asn)/Glu-tRNA(Gln) amidotransferase subunit GatA [Eubacterium sp.]